MNSASPTIIGNVISQNTLAAGGFGGGIEVSYFGRPIIQGNTIIGNYAYNYGGGIDITNYDGAVVSQNLILNNSVGTGGSGGGISVYASSTVNIINNTVVGNSASDLSSGIYIASGSPQTNTVANNIVIATAGQTALVCNPTWSSVSPVFLHNDIFSPSGSQSTGVCDLSTASGTVSIDPLFVNANASDYHLQASSSLIDAGVNGVVDMAKSDRDGKPRLTDGNNDCISTVDLGAYELQGNAVATLSPSSMTFPTQAIGTEGSEQPATLSSTGSTCLQISSITTSPDFLQNNNCGIGVPSGTSCTIAVSFKPTAAGPRSGSLSVDSNLGSPLSIALSGSGGVPVAQVTPTSLNFGNQLLGSTSGIQQVTLTNTGDGSLQFSGATVTGDFVQSGGTCSGSLPPAGSCAIYVAFKPTVTGVRSGTLKLSTNSSISTPVVALSGTGVTGAPSFSPTSVSFGNVQVGGKVNSRTVTLTATGPGPLQIFGATVSAGFTLNNKCGGTLSQGASCSLVISFKPTVAGTVTGSLTVVDSGLGSPHSVTLSGTGVGKH